MLVLQGRRSEMLAQISAHPEADAIFLKTKPSVSLFVYLLNKTRVRRILCSPAIKRTFPRKALPALAQMGIEISETQLKRGRPFVIGEGKILQAKASLARGESVAAVAKQVGLAERTLYYRLREARRKKEI